MGKLRAQVDVVELLGASAVLHMTLDEHELRAVVPEQATEDLSEGSEVDLTLDAARIHVFDESGRRACIAAG